MFTLSPCIDLLFTEDGRPFPQRIHAAAENGFEAVEMWLWRDKDVDAIRRALDETGLEMTSLVVEPWARLVDPSTHPEFLRGVTSTCEVAQQLGATSVVAVAGDEIEGADRHVQRAAVVQALRQAAPIAADAGVTLVLEPLNTKVEHPGHFLYDTVEGLEIVAEVDHAKVRILYDLYHSVMMNEIPREVLKKFAHLVGHVQIADAPGRGEPGTGNVDWANELRVLHELGYRGRIGLEYFPQKDTVTSLSHIRDVLETIKL